MQHMEGIDKGYKDFHVLKKFFKKDLSNLKSTGNAGLAIYFSPVKYLYIYLYIYFGAEVW